MSLDVGEVAGHEVPAAEQVPGAPGELPPSRQPGRQLPALLGPGLLRALVLAFLGYLFGHWFGNALASGYKQVVASGDGSLHRGIHAGLRSGNQGF